MPAPWRDWSFTLADRRQDAATFTVGTGLTAGGGVARRIGVDRAWDGHEHVPGWVPKRPLHTHQLRALVRRGARGRVLYGAGAVAGLIGAPAMAVSATDALHRRERTAKADHPFLRSGLTGTGQAFNQRIASARETPPDKKVKPLAVGTAAGALGSLATHRALDRMVLGRSRLARAGLTAVGGSLAATGSLPISRRLMRNDSEYQVTAAGVRRRKQKPSRPSSKATVVDGRRIGRGQFRSQTVGKVDNPDHLPMTTARGTVRKVHLRHPARAGALCGTDGAFGRGLGPYAQDSTEVTCAGCRRLSVSKAQSYVGSRTSYTQQRASTMAAGAIPLLPLAGPLAAAHQAGRYAPPGQKRRAEGRQLASSAGTTVASVGGAYWAASNPRIGAKAESFHAGATRAANAVTRPVSSRMPHGSGRGLATVARARSSLAERGLATAAKHPHAAERAARVVAPLARNKKAALAGYFAAKTLTGQPMQNLAISRNIAAQRRYNAQHGISKAMAKPRNQVHSPAGPNQTACGFKIHEPGAHRSLTVTHRKEHITCPMCKVLGDLDRFSKAGTGLTTSQQRDLVRRQRRKMHADIATTALGASGLGLAVAARSKRLTPVWRSRLDRAALHQPIIAGAVGVPAAVEGLRITHRQLQGQERALGVSKADQQIHTDMHEQEARRLVYGRGGYGLTGTLPRNLDRNERMRAYQARYITAGGHKAQKWQHRAQASEVVRNASLAGATTAGAGLLARHWSHIKPLERAGVAAATVGGAAEMYGEYARHKRSKYTSAPGGVAASALRRMQNYPGGNS